MSFLLPPQKLPKPPIDPPGHYCSAFGDVERQFASLGNFFDLDPQSGTFEANPPFVPAMMDAMLDRIMQLLQDPTRGPLSFLVVVPSWGAGVAMCRKLASAEVKNERRADLCIPASDHGFCDGSQHALKVCRLPTAPPPQ